MTILGPMTGGAPEQVVLGAPDGVTSDRLIEIRVEPGQLPLEPADMRAEAGPQARALPKRFSPAAHLWHTVAAPHVWVKYQGPEGSAGVQPVVRELVRFDTPPAPPLAVPLGPLPDGLAGAAAPGAHPAGSWSAPPATLASLLVLAALAFVLGVEYGATVFPALRVREARAKGDEE